MSTQELPNGLREMGKSSRGQRSVLVRRYEQAAPQEGDVGHGANEAINTQATLTLTLIDQPRVQQCETCVPVLLHSRPTSSSTSFSTDLALIL